MKVRVDAIVLDEPMLAGKYGQIVDVENDELALLWVKRQWCARIDEDKPPERAVVETPESNQAAAEKETATVRRRGRPPAVET
jgi:hypothetical protein